MRGSCAGIAAAMVLMVCVRADDRAAAAAWAASCAKLPGLAVDANWADPLNGPGGPNGEVEFSRRIAWGWAAAGVPVLRVDETVTIRPERLPPSASGRPIANPPRRSVLWATPAREVVDVQRSYSGLGGSFSRSRFEPTRRAAITDAWMLTPTLLGRMLHEEIGRDAAGLREEAGFVRATVDGVPVAMRFMGPARLLELRFERPNGGTALAEYEEFSAAPPAAGVEIQLPGRVYWAVIGPAEAPGPARAARGVRATLTAPAASPIPPADTFIPDLAGLTMRDPTTGEIRDAQGNLLLVIPPRSSALAWVWVLGAGALGAVVLTGGAAYWRRRLA